jgi:DedD protein
VDTSLKQRLLGAAILVALAVIFIPMLFDGSSREKSVTSDMQIPPEPEYTFEKPFQVRPTVESKAKAKPPASQIRPAEIASADAPSRKPARKPTSTPKLTNAPKPGPVRQPAPQPAGALSQAPTAKLTREARPVTEAETTTEESAIADLPAEEPQAGMKTPRSQAKSAARAKSAEPFGRPDVLESSKRAESSPEPVLTAWSVQVGSFSEQKNALSLLNKLRNSGFAAFKASATSGGDRVFRVMVGPEFNRKRAERLLARLRKQENLQGIVVSQPPAFGRHVPRSGG